MLPSNFKKHPYNSVMNKSEAETIARNIMVILSRTGDKFRQLSWDEYKTERLKDGDFTEREKAYFDKVVSRCSSVETALHFSPTWGEQREEVSK